MLGSDDHTIARAARGAALGALAGSLFNSPGTGAVVGGLLGLGGGVAHVRDAQPSDVTGSCVILFYATWCPACTNFRSAVLPRIPEELAQRGRSDLPVLQINIDHRPGLNITGERIQRIPTIVFIDSAKKPRVYKGAMTAAAIADFAASAEALVPMSLEGGAVAAPPRRRKSPRRKSPRRKSPRRKSPRHRRA